MSHDKLQEILAEHARWMRRQRGPGAYLANADLTGANLRGAYLAGAYLPGATLAGADLTCLDLSGADLTGATLGGGEYRASASVQFSRHGECGRELLALMTDAESAPVTLWCGCFVGTPEELAKYIAEGDERHRESRTLAMETVLMLLEYAVINNPNNQQRVSQ